MKFLGRSATADHPMRQHERHLGSCQISAKLHQPGLPGSDVEPQVAQEPYPREASLVNYILSRMGISIFFELSYLRS